VLLGDSGVGKSSILVQYITQSFRGDQDTTIGAVFMTKAVEYNGKLYKFQIWDTAGQERYHSLAKTYYHDVQAAILVYDITSEKSFSRINTWHEELV
jgi:small GTP-binding protein